MSNKLLKTMDRQTLCLNVNANHTNKRNKVILRNKETFETIINPLNVVSLAFTESLNENLSSRDSFVTLRHVTLHKRHQDATSWNYFSDK